VIGEELKAEARSVKSHERQLTKLNKICNVQREQQPSGRKGMPVPEYAIGLFWHRLEEEQMQQDHNQ
jgi:hypothetical protein